MDKKEYEQDLESLVGADPWIKQNFEEALSRAGFKPKADTALDNKEEFDNLTLFDVNYGLGIGLSKPLLHPTIAQKIKVSDIISKLPKGPLIGEDVIVQKKDSNKIIDKTGTNNRSDTDGDDSEISLEELIENVKKLEELEKETGFSLSDYQHVTKRPDDKSKGNND